MTLPEIEKVTKILTKVKQLDSEIIAIEKMARTLSENIYDVDFGLSFTPVVKNDKVDVLDSDGFLKKDTQESGFIDGMGWISCFKSLE